MTVSLRLEHVADREPLRRVHRLAFGQEAEGALVDALRDGGYARVSVVAEKDTQVAGHVLFSNLPILTHSGPIPALSLAPIAVLPELQNQGIGSALLRRGLEICRDEGHRIVVVVGHPRFYQRAGFSPELARRIESPYAGDAFMALELIAGALDGLRGKVQYPPPFDVF